MQPGDIALIGQRTEYPRLCVVGIAEHRQRLVAMRGDDDVIVAPALPAPVRHGNTRRVARDTGNARAIENAAFERLHELLHIFARAARHRPPGRPDLQAHQTVIVEEAQESERRKLLHLFDGKRPDRRAHRQQVIVAQARRIALLAQEVAERLFVEPLREHERRRRSVKLHDVADHPPHAQRRDVAPVREQSVEPGARIFEAPPPARIERSGERHVAFLRRDAEMIEHGGEVRIVRFIVDDEARIDRHLAFRTIGDDRVRVSARPRGLLVDRDVVA